jgi:hypothetical protein
MNEDERNDLQDINIALGETQAFLHLADHAFGLALARTKWLLDKDRWRNCGCDSIEEFAESTGFDRLMKTAAKQREEIVALFRKAGLSVDGKDAPASH